MTRKKRTSRILEKAQLRAAGLKMVDPSLDLGDSCSLANMQQQMNTLREQIEAYNGALAVIDSSKQAIDELEKSLGDLIDRMLTGSTLR